MNRQSNDCDALSSNNTTPSCSRSNNSDRKELGEGKVDTLLSSFYATANSQRSMCSSSNNNNNDDGNSDNLFYDSSRSSSSNLFDTSNRSISSSATANAQEQAQRRMQMTEHYLLKALQLDSTPTK